MQQQLFPSDKTPKSKGLIISKAGKQKLSKNQDAFNKLTQKIEKLQKSIEKKQLQFDLALKIYGTELYPVELEILEKRHKLLTVLFGIYKTNRLSKTDQRHLKNVLKEQLENYFSATEIEPDEEIQNIFSELEGISYDKMMQAEKDDQNAKLQEMFEKMNVDMEGLDVNDEEAVLDKLYEAKQKLAEKEAEKIEKAAQRHQNRKKTPKQLESEKMQKAVDEMKQKNISTIYKQLAKLFHPDLEQDTDRKADKEILMKELIAAYEAKNLHALLSLELKWIHKETDHLESLTEEKLAIYLQILREQVTSLERENYTIFQQPQYAALANQFGYGIQRDPVNVLHHHVKEAKDLVNNFKTDIADFEGDMALRNVKDMIKQWKQQDKEPSDVELMQMFFNGQI